MEGQLPIEPLPFVWCDFNACGWAGNGDESYYALDKKKLAALVAYDGMRVFLYDNEEPGMILGCVAQLRYVTVEAFSGWRAEPAAGTWYRGSSPSIAD